MHITDLTERSFTLVKDLLNVLIRQQVETRIGTELSKKTANSKLKYWLFGRQKKKPLTMRFF